MFLYYIFILFPPLTSSFSHSFLHSPHISFPSSPIFTPYLFPSTLPFLPYLSSLLFLFLATSHPYILPQILLLPLFLLTDPTLLTMPHQPLLMLRHHVPPPIHPLNPPNLPLSASLTSPPTPPCLTPLLRLAAFP